jgi:hypothetical protein
MAHNKRTEIGWRRGSEGEENGLLIFTTAAGTETVWSDGQTD